jgi:hypothetical protein
MSLTSEDGQSYAQEQWQRQGDSRSEVVGDAPRIGEIEAAAGTGAPSATAPTSQKLADLVTRLVTTFSPDDLAVLNSAVVELQAYESALAAPPSGAPVIVDVPYASQDAGVLSCTMGNWQNEPSSYAYQWQLDGSDAGTASDTAAFTVTADDAGKTATCVVTATNDAGSATAPTSNPVVVADPSSSQDAARTGQRDQMPAREA